MDAVLKIGGSVLQKDSIQELCSVLDELIKEFSFVVIPGGGEYANLIRKYYNTFLLSDDTAHWMAILSENILGFLLLEHLKLGAPAFSLSDVPQILKTSKIPIFMPFQHMFKLDPLPHSWDVTSDSIAAYLAETLQAQKIILLKDVDGIYTRDPKLYDGPNVKLVEIFDLKKTTLSDYHSCVDKHLPILLKKYHRSCIVVNGLYPERVGKILRNQKTIYTLIKI